MRRLLVVALQLLLVAFLHSQDCVPQPAPAPAIKPPIRNVVFRNAGLLATEERREIAKAVREDMASFDAAEGGSISRLAGAGSERVRAAYQDQGYLEAQVTARAVPVGTDAARLYDILIQVQEAGPLDRFGEMKIIHATVFPEMELRDLFPIQRGAIFSREKIAKGLEELRRVYASAGYINFTAVPSTEFDDANELMNLQIDVDEGRQFRMRNIEILGVGDEEKDLLLRGLGLETGALYTPQIWELALHNLPLAPDDPNTVSQRLDEREGWVDVALDLRQRPPCPIDPSAPTAIPRSNLEYR